MPRKGKNARKSVEISWDDECCGGKDWKKYMFKRHWHHGGGGGFFGRALFAIGVLMLVNSMGVFNGQPLWLPWLIGIGFALMSF